MEIDFVLSQTDARPMYQQIMEQVSRRVAVGDWPPGTKLPSIREMAIALQVSIITVKRAYLELEREGLILTRQGKGSWISEDLSVTDVRHEELRQHLHLAASLAASLSIDSTELHQLLADALSAKGESND